MRATAHFKVETDEHVAWLILDRPEKRNTMGTPFFKELSEHLDKFDRDPTIRAVVIKAEGKSFTAGTDLNEAASLLSGKGADQRENTRIKILALQAGLTAIEKCRKPVIAAVHSHCIGGGIDLISACDVRLATKDAVFSIRALITKVKKPRVRILIGRVIRSAMGLKSAFKIPSMAAARNAARNPSTWIPFSM